MVDWNVRDWCSKVSLHTHTHTHTHTYIYIYIYIYIHTHTHIYIYMHQLHPPQSILDKISLWLNQLHNMMHP